MPGGFDFQVWTVGAASTDLPDFEAGSGRCRSTFGSSAGFGQVCFRFVGCGPSCSAGAFRNPAGLAPRALELSPSLLRGVRVRLAGLVLACRLSSWLGQRRPPPSRFDHSGGERKRKCGVPLSGKEGALGKWACVDLVQRLGDWHKSTSSKSQFYEANRSQVSCEPSFGSELCVFRPHLGIPLQALLRSPPQPRLCRAGIGTSTARRLRAPTS